MVCIHCNGQTQVTNSRHQKRSNQVWRRRRCLDCGNIFTSYELTDFATSLRVRLTDGKLVPFNRDKLFLSLHKSLSHRPSAIPDADSLAATIISKVTQAANSATIDCRQIVQIVTVALNRFDHLASSHYQAFHGLGS